jgi:uncharacterized protein
MQKNIQLKLPSSDAAHSDLISRHIADALGINPASISGFNIIKQSLDARGRQAHNILSLQVFIDEPFQERKKIALHLRDVTHAAKKVIIIGAGPAGLFAAIKLTEYGIRVILLERGKEVRARRRDLALLNKEGILNPESNYCFGEGGAGTYSDGKLYTRSTKRGDLGRILQILVQAGAAENILYESHPHIGTNKLPQIITNIRDQLRACGNQILFEEKVTDLIIKNESLESVIAASGNRYEADAVILATGHSARDIFELLYRKQIKITQKPFALGVRIEHPQELIDSIQYGPKFIETGSSSGRPVYLPAASYSLVDQVNQKAVFSFCMCPGGIIATASTHPAELVINGWSPSRRNNRFANSGIVVNVEESDCAAFHSFGPLAGMHFQKDVESRAFTYGGGKFVAPAQRMIDFVDGKISASLPDCSYLPGIRSAPMNEILPDFVYQSLRQAFRDFGKKMRGYYTNEAVILATESRTSSPVRIPRDPGSLQHPSVKNLYPCGEGAGYAGGIVSAAMDGERVAAEIARVLI